MLHDRLRMIIMDPLGFVKNWWVTVIAAMVLGDALSINAKISDFLSKVSGGRLR